MILRNLHTRYTYSGEHDRTIGHRSRVNSSPLPYNILREQSIQISNVQLYICSNVTTYCIFIIYILIKFYSLISNEEYVINSGSNHNSFKYIPFDVFDVQYVNNANFEALTSELISDYL